MSESDNLTNYKSNKSIIDNIIDIDSKLESIIYYVAKCDKLNENINGSTVTDPPCYSDKCIQEIEDTYMVYFLSTLPSTKDPVKLVKDGDYYGEEMNEMKHGRGIFIEHQKNGEHTRYEGYWKNNLYHGEGTMYYFNAQKKQIGRYKGDFKKGKRHGNGEYIFESGLSMYKGRWKNDKKYYGMQINQKETYVGYFQGNHYHGYGTITYHVGTKEQYTGYFKEGHKHGFGESKHNDYFYKGEWKKDKQNGRGLLSRKIREYEEEHGEYEEYNGDFLEGKYHGNGILIIKRNIVIITKYQGQFNKGNKHGKGVEFNINDQKKRVEKWEHGRRIELKESELFSLEFESIVPNVNNLPTPYRLALWITSLLFTFLFFLVGLINIIKLSSWKYFGTIVAFYSKGYPLKMNSVVCYLLLIIIDLIMLGMFLVLLLSKKLSKSGVEPLLNLFEYPTILFLIPLGLAVPYPFFALSTHVVVKIVICIVSALISIISIIFIFIILFRGKLTLFTVYDWIIKRVFLSTLMFLHYYVFMGSIAGLVLINWDPFDYNYFYLLHWMRDSEIAQIILCLLFLGGECTWTFMMKDCVMGAYGFLFSLGLLVEGRVINTTKVFRNATLAYGSLGLIANIVLVILGFFLYGKEMAFPSYDGLID